MNVSLLIQSIQQHEGLRLKPYSDSVGKLTVGYGRNLTDNGISEDEASYLLSNDLQSCIREAQAQDWWAIVGDNDARSRAMVEILFNIGISRLNGFVNALESLRNGDFSGAAEGFRQSKWYTQVGQRAIDLTSMIDNGQ